MILRLTAQFGSGKESVRVYDPDPSVRAVPTIPPLPSITVIVDPGSAVPANVGVVVVRVAPASGVSTTGAAGNEISITTITISTNDILPSRSIDATERVCVPSERGIASVTVNDPSGLTIVSAIIVPDPSVMVIVVPGSAVPANVGVGLLSVAPEAANDVSVGVTGGIVSAMIVRDQTIIVVLAALSTRVICTG